MFVILLGKNHNLYAQVISFYTYSLQLDGMPKRMLYTFENK